MTWEYAIKGILHYQLEIGGPNGNQNMIYWDFKSNVFRVGVGGPGPIPPPIPTATPPVQVFGIAPTGTEE
jgi:hypothetical protein